MTGRVPSEEDIRARCQGNGLVALMLLLDADETLRDRFRRNPSEVLRDFALGRPADLVGVRGRACPAMPALTGGGADDDVADPHWRAWLRGGLRQVEPYRSSLPQEHRLPPRSEMSTLEWAVLVERVRRTIVGLLDDLHR